MYRKIDENIEEHSLLMSKISNKNFYEKIRKLSEILNKTIVSGNKVLLMGNGGSASDSNHIVAEIVGKYKTRTKGFFAVSLSSNNSVITSISNDFGYNQVFSKQIESIASENDLIIGLTTSGKSLNIIKGLQAAKSLGCHTACLTGQYIEEIKKNADLVIKIPSDNTQRIQEMHILIGHILVDLLE